MITNGCLNNFVCLFIEPDNWKVVLKFCICVIAGLADCHIQLQS